VIDYANYVLTQPKTQLRHWKKDYYDVYGFNNRPYLYQRYTQPEEEANLLITTVQSRWARELPTAKYGFTTQLMNNNAAYYTPATSPTPVYNGMYIAKFDELSLFGSTGSKPTDLYVSNVLFTTDEVMLNRMEAYAMLKNYNQLLLEYREFQKIKFDNPRNITVEDLIASTDDDYRNYSPFYGLSIRQLGAIKNIAFLRQWEFMHEGMRWLDIRRFYTPVNRTNEPLQKEDLRKVIQLPIEAINRAFLETYGTTVPPEPVYIDGELPAALLNLDWARYLERLEPWGASLPVPVFANPFEVLDCRLLGSAHTRLVLREMHSGNAYNASWFFHTADYRPGTRLRIAYQLQVNRFYGDERLSLLVQHAQPL